jgi:hypothetical protein
VERDDIVKVAETGAKAAEGGRAFQLRSIKFDKVEEVILFELSEGSYFSVLNTTIPHIKGTGWQSIVG